MGRAPGSILGSNRVGRHNAGVQRRWINLLPPVVTFLLGEVVGQQQRRNSENDGNRGRLEAPPSGHAFLGSGSLTRSMGTSSNVVLRVSRPSS